MLENEALLWTGYLKFVINMMYVCHSLKMSILSGGNVTIYIDLIFFLTLLLNFDICDELNIQY